jgi:hypothetical protein
MNIIPQEYPATRAQCFFYVIRILLHRIIISWENNYIMHDYHATKMPWQLVQRATAAAQGITPQKHPTTPHHAIVSSCHRIIKQQHHFTEGLSFKKDSMSQHNPAIS